MMGWLEMGQYERVGCGTRMMMMGVMNDTECLDDGGSCEVEYCL